MFVNMFKPFTEYDQVAVVTCMSRVQYITEFFTENYRELVVTATVANIKPKAKTPPQEQFWHILHNYYIRYQAFQLPNTAMEHPIFPMCTIPSVYYLQTV